MFCMNGVSYACYIDIGSFEIWKESAIQYSYIIYFLPSFTFTIWKFWAALKSKLVYFLQYSLQAYDNGKFKYYSFCVMCHLCDMDRCMVKTSLWLHNFGRRFYGCREWTSVSLHLRLITLFILCHKFHYLAYIDIIMYATRWWLTL